MPPDGCGSADHCARRRLILWGQLCLELCVPPGAARYVTDAQSESVHSPVAWVKDLFLTLFAFLGEHWKDLNSESVYIIDSSPIASCDNIRIHRSRRYQGEDYRGYLSSKKRYFYGLRLHLVVTATGEPVEFFLIPGEESDTGALQWYQFDLPAGSKILGDKAFNVYDIEDDLASIGIELCPLRKKNSKRAIPPWEPYLRELYRKYIETTGSVIMQRFPKTIHAVTAAGFELKLVLFLLAYSFDCLAR